MQVPCVPEAVAQRSKERSQGRGCCPAASVQDWEHYEPVHLGYLDSRMGVLNPFGQRDPGVKMLMAIPGCLEIKWTATKWKGNAMQQQMWLETLL